MRIDSNTIGENEEMNKPLFCRLGFHRKYKYLPKVGGDLGDISFACKRCGYGHRYFANTWDITPQEVEDAINKQPEIEFGRVVSTLNHLNDPVMQMERAFKIIEDKFTDAQLDPIKKCLEHIKK